MGKGGLIFSHIAAAARNNCISRDGKLPWRIPEDLKWFHDKTTGKALIMGRKTYESLSKPLPHRLNVVVTRQGGESLPSGSKIAARESLTDLKAAPLAVCSSIEAAVELCSQKDIVNRCGKEIFITGGGEIFRKTVRTVDRIYLTRIHADYKGDVFYPEIPEGLFHETARKDELSKDRLIDKPVRLSFITYERKK